MFLVLALIKISSFFSVKTYIVAAMVYQKVYEKNTIFIHIGTDIHHYYRLQQLYLFFGPVTILATPS